MEQRQTTTTQTAGEVGWRISRYNLFARIPGTDKTIIANLFRGNCAVYSPIELYLLDELETLNEHHPIIELCRWMPQQEAVLRPARLPQIQACARAVCVGTVQTA